MANFSQNQNIYRLVASEEFGQWLSSVVTKLIGRKSPHDWIKIVISYTQLYASSLHNPCFLHSCKNAICHFGIVTSNEPETLAVWRYLHSIFPREQNYV